MAGPVILLKASNTFMYAVRINAVYAQSVNKQIAVPYLFPTL